MKVPYGAITVASAPLASAPGSPASVDAALFPFAWLINADGKLYDGTSRPARRAGFALKNNQSAFNNEGWLIFDSMTKWCLGKL